MEVSRVVHLAASAGDLPTLERVIRDTPALLEARNEHGRTPLMAAAKGGRLGAVELLLNDGAAIDERETGTFETALYKATSEGYWRVVELLLERGANCYLGDLSGVTPLMEAARKGYGRVTRCLLEHQQDRHRRGLVDAAVEVDGSGRSALWWSACWGNAAVLHLLLTKGEGATADLHRPDCHNVTPMHVTRRRPLRRRDLCGALLEEADRHYQLWKTRVLVEREAALSHVGRSCVPVLPAALRHCPLPSVRVPLGATAPAGVVAQGGAEPAASACVAAGASVQEGEEVVASAVLRHVLEGLNSDLFRELLDTLGRTVPLALVEVKTALQATRRAGAMPAAAAAGRK